MYKAGDKFIIEIGESYETQKYAGGDPNRPETLYRAKCFNSLVFDENGLDKLEKYEENKGYEKGLSDAWECMRKIKDNDILTNQEIFEVDYQREIIDKYTPQEAIDKLKAWEEKQKIRVGDVIRSTGGSVAMVQYIDAWDMWQCFSKDGYFHLDHDLQRYWKKTGKHIDLTEIFKGLEVEDEDEDR